MYLQQIATNTIITTAWAIKVAFMFIF